MYECFQIDCFLIFYVICLSEYYYFWCRSKLEDHSSHENQLGDCPTYEEIPDLQSISVQTVQKRTQTIPLYEEIVLKNESLNISNYTRCEAYAVTKDVDSQSALAKKGTFIGENTEKPLSDNSVYYFSECPAYELS